MPFFVLDRRYGVSGAQPPEALLGALERAWGEAVSLDDVKIFLVAAASRSLAAPAAQPPPGSR